MIALPFLNELRPTFVAHLADRLSAQVCAQTEAIFVDRGMTAPVKSISPLLYLLREGPASLTEMARHDGQSHQLLASRLDPLEKIGLIERTIDPNDARRRPYALTRRGAVEARLAEAACKDIADAMRATFKDIGIDMLKAIDLCMASLDRVPLTD